MCPMFSKNIFKKYDNNDLENKKEKESTVSELLFFKDSVENNSKLISSILRLNKNQNITQSNVFDDLEVFQGNDSIENSIFNVINKTTTIFGNIYIRNILETPTKDIELLKNRQNILNKITSDLVSKIKEKLKVLKDLEEEILWILREKNPEELKLIDSVYFTNKYLTMFNTNEDIMSLYSLFTIIFAPVYGIVSPIIFFILPYIYLYFFTGLKFSFKTYIDIFKVSILSGFNIFSGTSGNNMTKYFSVLLSIIIYFQNFANTIEAAKNNNKIINVLHSKLNKLYTFVNTSQELFNLTKDLFKHDDIEIFDTSLENDLFKTNPKLLSNKGKILVTYRHIEDNENHIEKYKTYFNFIGKIDAYISIVSLVKEFNDKNLNICYTRYETNVNPSIKLKDLWHPYLAKNKKYTEIQSNSINIGGENPNNIILTGPNAGGKSTFIKAISLSMLFSQTFGISFSKEAYITPMTLINTYLNIPDCKNKESLFEAEMHRARHHLDKLKELGKHDFSFIVMDEIFSSTNPEEGISGAYAICNKLAEYTNSIALITTHFSYLTKLETSGKYKNYKIPIKRNELNEIVYPYKLQEGASDQHIALELLKKKGFDIELVDDAMSVCQQLKLSYKKQKKKEAQETVEEEQTVEDTIEEEQTVEDTIEEEQTVKDTIEEEQTVKDTIEEEQTVKDTIEEEQTVEDTIEEEQTVEDTIEEEQTVEDTMEEEQTVEDTIEEEQTVEETVEDTIEELVKITAPKKRKNKKTKK